MREIIQYTSKFGFYNYLQVWLRRIVWLSILLVALGHYNENPNGLTILGVIIIITLFRIRSEQLIVYDKSIEIKRKFLFDLVPISSNIQKEDIEDIKIRGNRTLKNDIIQHLIPFGLRFQNIIEVNLINGNLQNFKTSIFTEELESFIEEFEKRPQQ